MFRLVFFGVLIFAIVLAVTNPGLDAHKSVVYQGVAAKATDSKLLGKIAADVLAEVDIMPLQYNNYFLFSTTAMDGRRKSIGVLSKVWKWE